MKVLWCIRQRNITQQWQEYTTAINKNRWISKTYGELSDTEEIIHTLRFHLNEVKNRQN